MKLKKVMAATLATMMCLSSFSMMNVWADKKEDSESQILLLQKAEHEKAHEIATSINCNLYVHHMLFDETDITSCLSYIERGPKL